MRGLRGFWRGGLCGCWVWWRRDAGVRLRGVEVLDAVERAEVLGRWNETAAEVPGGSVAELIVARAGRVPDAAAVGGGGVWVSYG